MKVLSLFSGIGAFEKALTRMGIDYELVNFCEFDKYAIKSYCAIHGVDESKNLGDITKVDAEALPKDIDLITYGFPCFVGNTLVLTNDGYKNIVDINEGDFVLSHDNKWHKVTKTMNQGKKEIWKIKGMSFDEIKTTENHKFFVRKTRDSEPEWIECKDLKPNYLMGYAINQNERLPKWEGVKYGRWEKLTCNLNMNDSDFWYLCGRYLGDGWCHFRKDRNNNFSKVVICCGKHKADVFESKISSEFHYTKTEERTVYKYIFSNKELATFMSQFGKGAIKKRIPSFVFDLPKEHIKALLDGYFDSDGWFDDTKNRYHISSISRELIYGVGQLIAKAYHRHFSIYHEKREETCVIEGRTVKQHDSFEIAFSLEKRTGERAFYKDESIWFPINKIEKTSEVETVYDIAVEDAHSFTANGAIAHNCQDISLAGKQKGLFNEDGTQTRSGLFFEALRIIEATKPKVAIAENVKNLTSKKFSEQFKIVLESLEMAGYNNYWKVLNAKDYGIPQNRERVFIISIRKDVDTGTFDFPKPFPLELRLKDLLQDYVAPKYYVSNDNANKLLKKLTESDVEYKDGVLFCGMQKNQSIKTDGVSTTLTSSMGTGGGYIPMITDPRRIGGLFDNEKSKHQAGSILDKECCGPTIDTMQGGYRQPLIIEDFYKSRPERVYEEIAQTIRADRSGLKVAIEDKQESEKVLIPQATKQGYIECEVGGVADLSYPNSKTRRGRMQDNGNICPTITSVNNEICRIEKPESVERTPLKFLGRNQKNIEGDYAFCVDTAHTGGIKENYADSYRIRKLTPKECFRLMGFDDADFKKAEAVNSNSQLYKQAGNSIVVNVLECIFKNLFSVNFGLCEKDVDLCHTKGNGLVDEIFVDNPLKGKTQYGWHFEQNVYSDNTIIRALKASGGSGNIPKVIIENKEEFYFWVETEEQVPIERFNDFESALEFCKSNSDAVYIFKFLEKEDELIDCVYNKSRETEERETESEMPRDNYDLWKQHDADRSGTGEASKMYRVRRAYPDRRCAVCAWWFYL